MPIYEYRCKSCNTLFEYLVMGGNGPEGCPECKSDQIRREMSACGFLSKGSDGTTISSSASSSSCAGCTASSCAGCG